MSLIIFFRTRDLIDLFISVFLVEGGISWDVFTTLNGNTCVEMICKFGVEFYVMSVRNLFYGFNIEVFVE